MCVCFTLHSLRKQSACFFPQTMRHQSLMRCWTLIGFAPLCLNPLLMEIFWTLNIHIFGVTPSKNVIRCMFYAVHLFCFNNRIAFLVCIRKQLLASL